MKIGIDLDGVVFDSENVFKTYAEIYDIDYLKGNHLINKNELFFQQRYSWSNEQQNEYVKEFFMKVSQESPIMAGFKQVYDLLKKDGHEFVVITARGGLVSQMKEDAEKRLLENGIVFDRFYFQVKNKAEVCKMENVDIMIDDAYSNVERIVESGIKTLYFRDAGMKKLEESKLLIEVNNWGDIYRCIKNMTK